MRYQALNYDVNRLWDRNGELRQGAVTQLRQAVAIDPHLQVLIVHGWNDLSCPFMGSILTVDQMPTMGSDPDRVQVRSYPGGHMFYSRADSQAAFRKMCRPCSNGIEGSAGPVARHPLTATARSTAKAGFLRAGEVGWIGRTRRKPVHGARWRHPWRQRSCLSTPPAADRFLLLLVGADRWSTRWILKNDLP